MSMFPTVKSSMPPSHTRLPGKLHLQRTGNHRACVAVHGSTAHLLLAACTSARATARLLLRPRVRPPPPPHHLRGSLLIFGGLSPPSAAASSVLVCPSLMMLVPKLIMMLPALPGRGQGAGTVMSGWASSQRVWRHASKPLAASTDDVDDRSHRPQRHGSGACEGSGSAGMIPGRSGPHWGPRLCKQRRRRRCWQRRRWWTDGGKVAVLRHLLQCAPAWATSCPLPCTTDRQSLSGAGAMLLPAAARGCNCCQNPCRIKASSTAYGRVRGEGLACVGLKVLFAHALLLGNDRLSLPNGRAGKPQQ